MLLAKSCRNLTREQLLEKAGELGAAYERNSGSCSQCTTAALRDILGFEDVIVKVATSSCGGQAGLSMGACGGVIGGTIVLDYYFGRDPDKVSPTKTVSEGMQQLSEAMEVARALCGRFVREYGSILCPQVQTRLFGRSFNLQDPADWKAFEEAGGHSDPSKCIGVVANAARWTLEVLMDKGVIKI